MQAGTSPAIAAQTDGSFRAVFEANTSVLAGYSSSGSSYVTTLGMMTGTSPSLVALSDGTYEAAFVANNADLALSHVGGSTLTTTLGMQAGTSPAIAVPAPAAAPAGDCAAAEDCTRQTFAAALLGYVAAPVTSSDEYAVETWEAAEGVDAACADQNVNVSAWPAAWANRENTAAGNPLATTELEPGSYGSPGNTSNVQEYVTGGGKTCWQWGVQAIGDTLQNGLYPGVLSVLRNPVSDTYTQCADLATAVGKTQWGTGNFSADC